MRPPTLVVDLWGAHSSFQNPFAGPGIGDCYHNLRRLS
jgi:hypothetical protein